MQTKTTSCLLLLFSLIGSRTTAYTSLGSFPAVNKFVVERPAGPSSSTAKTLLASPSYLRVQQRQWHHKIKSNNNYNRINSNNRCRSIKLSHQIEETPSAASSSSEDKSASRNNKDIISSDTNDKKKQLVSSINNNESLTNNSVKNGERQQKNNRREKSNKKANNSSDDARTEPKKFFRSGKTWLEQNDPNISNIKFLKNKTAAILRVSDEANYSLDEPKENNQADDGDNETTTTTTIADSPYAIGREIKADMRAFNWLLDSWAFSGQKEAPENAHKLLLRMEKLSNDREKNANNVLGTICPDVRSYTKVMLAFSRSGRVDAGPLAEKVLKRMQFLYVTKQNDAVKPNHHTYTALLEAYANSCAPGAAQRAEEIFQIMRTKYIEGDVDLQPTGRCYHALINAWAKSGEVGAAQRAEECIDRMYEADNPDVRPNTYHFNSVINAYAKSNEPGSALRAEEVLAKIERLREAGEEDVEPTTVGFNAVIDAWAKSGDEDAAERAEDLLRHMEYLYQEGQNLKCKPNTRSFNTVINAWAKSGHPDAAYKAEEVLNLMQKLQDAGDDEVKPDVHSYSTVINAWARSQVKGKAERSYKLLLQMKDLYRSGNKAVRPNIVIYNSIMNACAFTVGDIQETNKALEIAHSILRELDQSTDASADHVTYGTFFKVVAFQMPVCGTRDKVVDLLFRKCCKDGQVSNFVLQQLRNVAEEELYEKLIGHPYNEEIDVSKLPRAWSCNAVDGKWLRGKNRKGIMKKAK